MTQLTWLYGDQGPHFPDPEQALDEPNGLLAAGGSLSVPWLLNAYRKGIFPWYSEGDPILWWSPAPRCVLTSESVILSKRMRRWLRQQEGLKITLDEHFNEVIDRCAHTPRGGESGTWILPEMLMAYQDLFAAGYATAIAVWQGQTLIGGFYGVSMGQMLFGESMFSAQPNGSKVALAAAQWMVQQGVWQFIDAQVVSPHLLRLGALELPRNVFMLKMYQAIASPVIDRRTRFNSEACIKAMSRTRSPLP